MRASRGMGDINPAKMPSGKKDAVLLKKGGEVWDKPNPVKKHTKLTPAKKAKAKAMAKAAGRPYPNMVDNIRAARRK